jgi:pimeloyl-ACP methyl ester carboxylesterase
MNNNYTSLPLKKSTYILIHGAWHGSWCYKDIASLLIESGQTVIVPDLPGRSGSSTDNLKNINLNTYVDFITDLVKQQNSPVTLVGHSMAGVIISQVAENIPEKIEHLIYISAFIPENGQSFLDAANKYKDPGLSSEMTIDLVSNTVAIEKSPKAMECLFGDCNPEDAIAAMGFLQNTDAYQPLIAPIEISTERFGSIKKTYVMGRLDSSISLGSQIKIAAKNKCRMIILETGHASFISAKEYLADALLNNYGQPTQFSDRVQEPEVEHWRRC